MALMLITNLSPIIKHVAQGNEQTIQSIGDAVVDTIRDKPTGYSNLLIANNLETWEQLCQFHAVAELSGFETSILTGKKQYHLRKAINPPLYQAKDVLELESLLPNPNLLKVDPNDKHEKPSKWLKINKTISLPMTLKAP